MTSGKAISGIFEFGVQIIKEIGVKYFFTVLFLEANKFIDTNHT